MKQKIPFYGRFESTVRGWTRPEYYSLNTHNSANTFHSHIVQHQPNVSVVGTDEQVLEQRVIEKLANVKHRPSIIAVTDTSSESIMTGCFNQGADRVVAANQCTQNIFCALVNTLLPDDENTYYPYLINTSTQTIHFACQQIQLGKRAFDIVQYLFVNHGKIIPKQKILQDVWGAHCANGVTRRVETQICTVRQLLALDGSYGWKIVTRRNVGYGLLRV